MGHVRCLGDGIKMKAALFECFTSCLFQSETPDRVGN